MIASILFPYYSHNYSHNYFYHHFFYFLFSGYSTEGNVTEAFRMLNLMISKEILPNSYTLTALMKTCIKSGDWERARELLCIGKQI